MRVTKYLLGISILGLVVPGAARAAATSGTAAAAATDDAAGDGSENHAEGSGSTITVNADRLNKETSILPARAPTSIYGTSESILDTPRSVTQINTDQLTKDIILSSDDLAKYTPGITRGGGQNAA